MTTELISDREYQTLAALKNLYDAFYSLPIYERGLAMPYFEKGLGMAIKAIHQYKGQLAEEIHNAVAESGVNQRIQISKTK